MLVKRFHFVSFVQMDQYFAEQTGYLSPLSPLLYVHSMYSNMVDKLQNQFSVTWSFYAQSDNGRVVVVKSEPRVFIDGREAPIGMNSLLFVYIFLAYYSQVGHTYTVNPR